MAAVGGITNYPQPTATSDNTNAPAGLSYTTLFQLVPFYLERNDQDIRDFIPYAIMLAESKISNKMKELGQQIVASGTIQYQPGIDVPGSLQKPTLWRKTISMHWTGPNGDKYEDLYARSLEYCKHYQNNKAATDTTPKFYSDYNFDYWYITPEPANGDMVEVLYYAKLVPLSLTQPTNWFTVNAPELILFGTLLEMEPFIKNDKRIALWQSKYDDAMASLVTLDVTRIGDRNTLRQDQN